MASIQDNIDIVIKASREDEEAIALAELMDYDDSDEIAEEDRDSDSDYGRPHKSKGKRMCGRPKKKPTEEARVAAALEARRKRMRLNHSTPDSTEKNPRRHLFGPPGEWREPSETASPTPSKPANVKNDKKKINRARSPYSPTAGRMTRRKLDVYNESKLGEQSAKTSPSLHEGVSPASRNSLIVKLKTRTPSATMKVERHGKRKSPRDHATIQNQTGSKVEASGQGSGYMKTNEQKRATRSTTRKTRQWQGDEAATEAHNNVPESPQPKKTPAARSRRGIIASPVELPETPPDALTSASDNDDNDNDDDDNNTSPNPPHTPIDPPPSSPNTNTPSPNPSPSPLRILSTVSTFAPYPPMSPRSLSPFTRGVHIALENLLADHHSDPLASLIELVDALDDTRPIVNDWEHVTVMKGGRWVYQVMRDVWGEAEEGMDGEDENVDEDVEDVLGKVGEWVGREVERLGGGGGGG